MRGAWRSVQRSCGSARHRTSAVQQSWPAHVRHRSSKVEFNLAAIPPHLRRDKPRRKCSGRPGGSRPGCWRRSPAPIRPHQRPGQVLLFVGPCQRAQERSTPHQRLCSARTRAVPARGLEAVFPSHTAAVFVGGREPKVSRPLHRQSPLTPHAQRPPPGPTLRYATGPLWFRDSGTGTRIKAGADLNLIPRASHPSQRLKTIEVYQETHASATVPPRPTYPARRTEKGFIYIQQGAAAQAAAASLLENIKKWFRKLDLAGREGVPHVPLY